MEQWEIDFRAKLELEVTTGTSLNYGIYRITLPDGSSHFTTKKGKIDYEVAVERTTRELFQKG